MPQSKSTYAILDPGGCKNIQRSVNNAFWIKKEMFYWLAMG